MSDLNQTEFRIYSGDYIDHIGIPLAVVSYVPETMDEAYLELFIQLQMQPPLVPGTTRKRLYSYQLFIGRHPFTTRNELIHQLASPEKVAARIYYKIAYPYWSQITAAFRPLNSIVLEPGSGLDFYSVEPEDRGFADYIHQKTKNPELRKEMEQIPEPDDEAIWTDMDGN